MSLTNSKFSPKLIKDGNLHFSDEGIKFMSSSHSTEAVNSMSSCNAYSLYQSLYPSIDVLSNARSAMTSYGPSINPYVGQNMLNYPMVHPYLLETIQHAEQLSGTAKQHFTPRLFSITGQAENYLDIGPHPRRKNATRETTSILKAWLNEHQKNPYPTKGEKIMLAVITKMTLTQVSTWFANARRRLKKENKMTWSPNHKSDDELDDMDDTESTELLNRASQEMDAHSISNNFLLKLSNIREESQTSISETFTNNSKSDNNKPKIWSIADITSESVENEQSKNMHPINGNQNQIQSTNPSLSQPSYFFQNPAMQYLLWKHKEFYQLHFSNIISNMQRFRLPNDTKSRMLEESPKIQDNVYNDL